jgi:DNA-binding CsgD family transcriptional regulator
MTNRWFLGILFGLQALCALFFVSDIVISVAGLRTTPINWRLRELIEIAAAAGLILGTILGGIAIYRARARTRVVELQLRAASGAFVELLEEHFDTWGLTPAERDVAWFAVKGLSTQDIARMRNTSEGTVKAQSNAIYRKAGVSGRYQLLSLFVDELMTGASEIKAEQQAVTMAAK